MDIDKVYQFIKNNVYHNNRINPHIKNIEWWEKNNASDVYKYIQNNIIGNSIQEKIYLIKNNLHEPKRCETCGEYLKWINNYKGYPQFCSVKCKSKSQAVEEKRKQTTLKKYGTTTPLLNKEIQEKTKKTIIEKYGVVHPMKNENIKNKVFDTNVERYGTRCVLSDKDIREKSKTTMKEKYGVEFPSQRESHKQMMSEFMKQFMNNPEIRKQIVEKNIEKYGVDNPSKSEFIKNKIKSSTLENHGVEYYMTHEDFKEKSKAKMIEKYGVEYFSQSEQFKRHMSNIMKNPHMVENKKAKAKTTNIQRYGVDNYSKTNEYKDRVKQTNLEKYGTEYYTQSDQYKQTRRKNILIERPDYGKLEDEEFMQKHSIYDICEITKCSMTTAYKYLEKLNLHTKSVYWSNGEKSIIEWIKTIYNGELIINKKLKGTQFKPDIVIPDKKLIIEFNGVWWHSYEKLQDKYYHQKRFHSLNKLGYTVYQIFEHEWCDPVKRKIWESRIKVKLGLTENLIYGRKCSICEISSAEYEQFMNRNHLDGAARAKHRYALVYDNEVVSVMSFGKHRFSKNNFYELVRYAVKQDTVVIGGASKLFKHVLKNLNIEKLISYSSNLYSDGNLYKILGFEKESETLGYFYIKRYKKYNRMSLQKHKLKDMFNLTDADTQNKSTDQILKEHNFLKIFDAGQSKWIFKGEIIEKINRPNI